MFCVFAPAPCPTVIVTGVSCSTRVVVNVSGPCSCPSANVRLAGTETTAGLLLEAGRVKPAVAGPVRKTVTFGVDPPGTVEMKLKRSTFTDLTVRVAVFAFAP